MGLNTLATRATGNVIGANFFNDFNLALEDDFVGRNSSGVPTAGKNLGTSVYPWGVGRFNSLIVGGNLLDTSQIIAPQNIIVSGQVRSTSNQPAYLKPNGAALSALLEATATDFVFDINATTYTLDTDLTISGLTAAPGTNNTALVNDADATGQESTRTWGEPTSSKSITIGTVGANITALVGKWAAFKIVSGGNTEYFLAYVEDATTLSKCMRGFFYDSTYAPKNRIKFSNGDTITLMKAGWVFLQTNLSTYDVTYNAPVWGFTSPATPATGDYWFDFSINQWKRYDGASFVIINRTFIGLVVSDSTACVAARSVDFFKSYKDDFGIDVEVISNTQARTRFINQSINVYGNKISFTNSLVVWDITTDLAASADMYNASEQASTYYYAYVKDTGDTVLSDISPQARPDFNGSYHPHNPWRYVATVFNNGSSNLESLYSSEKLSEFAAVVSAVPVPGATHSHPTLAISAVPSGSKIKIFPGTYGAVSISKEVTIEGQGRGTLFTNVTFTSAAQYAKLSNLKFSGVLTFDSGAIGNEVKDVFVPASWSATASNFVDSNAVENQNFFQAMEE